MRSHRWAGRPYRLTAFARDHAASVGVVAFQRRDGYRLWVGGPVPKGAAGVTVRSTVVVRRGHEGSPYLLRHELVHVRQWRHFGLVRFLTRYSTGYVRGRLRGYGHHQAYLRIPLEIEADWFARRSLMRTERAGRPNTVAR